MTQEERDKRFQEQLQKDPELLDSFVQLLTLALAGKVATFQAMRRLRAGWFYCVCPADESAMKYRTRREP